MVTKAQTALEEIRKHICVNGLDGEIVLYETELAIAYGMSRTPIRQILQRLAYERLVYTKSGVGTVVTPLTEKERGRDLRTFEGLVAAVLLHDLPSLSVLQRSDILALGAFADAFGSVEGDMLYAFFARLHPMLTALIEDPILSDAFSASFWRSVRWALRDHGLAPTQTAALFAGFVDSLVKDQVKDASDLFNRCRSLFPA